MGLVCIDKYVVFFINILSAFQKRGKYKAIITLTIFIIFIKLTTADAVRG